MLNQFSRTQLLLGADNMDRLSNAKVAVFGIGGVGGYVVEALARSGVGSFVLVDDDKVCLTNINRQIIATRKTVGKYKVDVMKERILEINLCRYRIYCIYHVRVFFKREFMCILRKIKAFPYFYICVRINLKDSFFHHIYFIFSNRLPCSAMEGCPFFRIGQSFVFPTATVFLLVISIRERCYGSPE